jgi:signal transduction histidine kinase
VRADGVLGDEEPLRDLLGAQMLVEQQQHLELTCRENRGDLVGHARATTAFPHLLEQPPGDRARQGGLAVGGAAQEVDDPGRRLALQQVAGGAAADGTEEVLLGSGRREHDDLAVGRGLAQPRECTEPVQPRHREVEEDQIGVEAGGALDRLLAVRSFADDVEAVLLEQPGQRRARQRMVVNEEDSLCHRLQPLSAGGRLPTRVNVREDGTDDFQAFLWGQILLFGLLGASLALFLAHRSLHTHWALPELRLVLQTAVALAAGIFAVLAGLRFSVEGRKLDLLLSTGFLIAGLSTFCFSIAPVLGGQPIHRSEAWAGVVTRFLGWILIAAAPFTRGRTRMGPRALGNYCLAGGIGVLFVWAALRSSVGWLPEIDTLDQSTAPPALTGWLAAQALLNLLALVGFGLRFRNKREDLDRWLAYGATLMLFASLHYLFTPPLGSDYVSQGDFLRVLAYGVFLVGAWRAIRYAEFGRAVAEERARVAREIHDGLAQYLFAVATHATMLETADESSRAETVANLKEATTAAQQEARFAVLALSSASGNAPFDAALRRYVDFLTADGELAVELDIDSAVRLAPDEQIEVFRIVQEGLGNIRKHANATHAEVIIGERGFGERVVTIRDDGEGFDGETTDAGQGLKNIRKRAETIDGGFTLRSRPGFGTALEVVLRA